MEISKLKIKELIITSMDLKDEYTVNDIEDDMKLFSSEGLGLDSVDSLELIVQLRKDYGVKVTEENMDVLETVETIFYFLNDCKNG